MRRIVHALVFAAFVVAVGGPSCTTKTGHACSSAGGTCVFAGGGGPVCLVQAASSAQDCWTGTNAGWSCCLEIEGGPPDAAPDAESEGETGTPPLVDAAGDAPGADAAEASVPGPEAGEDGGGPDDASAD
jgi:hypothetical protein